MEEIWKDIEGFEGVYQISNFGRLRSSLCGNGWKNRSLVNKKGGYLGVVLTRKDGKNKSARIHNLVADAFIEKKSGNEYTHHIDGDKQNNRVENLERISAQRHNKLHAQLSESMTAGMKRYNQEIRPRRIVQINFNGMLIGTFRNAFDAGKESGVCARNILQVANKTVYKGNKTRKQAGGYIWMFEDEYLEKVNSDECKIF